MDKFNVGEAGALVHARAQTYANQYGCGFHDAVRVVLLEDPGLAADYEVDRQLVVGQQVLQRKMGSNLFAASKKRVDGWYTETFQDWTVSRGGGRTLYGQLTPEQKAALKPGKK